MKKRYGTSMKIFGYIIPGSVSMSRITVLSREAKQRLKWLDWYFNHGENARLTCRHFGISPDTFYRWKKRYKPKDLSSLEDDKTTRTPAKLPKPQTDPFLVKRIKELREKYPRWGKRKIWKLVKDEGWDISVTSVGRALSRLRAKGQLNEPAIVVARIEGRRRKQTGKRPYAVRKPWDYQIKEPGDLVEIDTVHVYPVPGQRRYQFTASDCIAKHTARIAATTISAKAAARILAAIEERFPYPIKAIQIDGGSEFKAEFERQCKQRGILLFVLPPRSPRLNGIVERIQRTSREEIYDLRPMPLNVQEHNDLLKVEDYIYNHIRPHDALDLMTPNSYYLARLIM